MKQQFIKKFSVFALSLVLISGCVKPDGSVDRQTASTIIGAGLGAVLGSGIGKGSGQIASIAVGTMLGSYVGSEFGRTLEERDAMYHRQTVQQSLENNYNGDALAWKNPENNHYGNVTPIKTFKDTESRRYCREYTQEVIIANQKQQAHGVGCRNEDGTWEIVK